MNKGEAKAEGGTAAPRGVHQFLNYPANRQTDTHTHTLT